MTEEGKKSEWKWTTDRMWWKQGRRVEEKEEGEELIVMSFVC